MTPLGLLNFLVLQWFGVRLARAYVYRQVGLQTRAVHALPRFAVSIAFDCEVERVPDGWRLLRWIWPLTGWWSDYRWIAKRP